MKNVYTWAAKPAKRSTTVGDLKAAKGKRKFTQVTANSIEEAAQMLVDQNYATDPEYAQKLMRIVRTFQQ